MSTLVVWFLVSLIALWLFAMLTLWNTQTKQTTDMIEELRPVATKSLRTLRRFWFLVLRGVATIRAAATTLITKLFFTIFPNAKKAFEKKDELTGLQQGPSSYFLMSISEGKELPGKEEPKIRRKRKNV